MPVKGSHPGRKPHRGGRRQLPDMRTADELVVEGRRLSAAGNMVVFLYPSQEWMAVELQTPFLRYERIPMSADEQNENGK